MNTSRVGCFLIASVVLGLTLEPAAAATSDAPIVFSGNVTKLAATTMAEVPASRNTVVVQVTSIAKKPESIALRAGDLVTVQVTDPAEFEVGAQAEFYADAWILGSGIAVKERGHGPSQGGSGASASMHEAQAEATDAAIREHVSSAELIVVGRVLSVKPRVLTTSVSTAAAPPPRISEHDPDWRDAVVQVESTVKGKPARQVVVRFPASRDIAWAASPKLKPGQTATFFLNSDQVSGSPMAMIAHTEVTAYTVLRANDVLPATEAAHVRTLVK
jgi:hypothetical protein